MKTVTVPFFISHQGCPHTCVFCDQRTISGANGVLPIPSQIKEKVALYHATAGARPLDIAFFGGTFTALPQRVQAELLQPLQPFLDSGIVRTIRVSTRPDYIDSGTVAWLAEHGVRTIELGIQSMEDSVLRLSGRGHGAADSLHAICCIKDGGLSVGAQLMPGLPGDTPVFSQLSLKQVIAAGADFVRIYPTVVLKGTGLARMYEDGEFTPYTLAEGIAVCKQLLQYALRYGVPVIRIGLQADSGLDSENIIAGCWHPALGQMVRSALFFDVLDSCIVPGQHVTVSCHPSRISDVIGLNRRNIAKFHENGTVVRTETDHTLTLNEVKVLSDDSCNIYSIINDIIY